MTLPLSKAKAHLSEVVRQVRTARVPVVITVDGEPAAVLAPVDAPARTLTPAEVATDRVLADAILRTSDGPSFDAVELVRDGRR
jgi:prevent-host-death family protein